MTHADIREKFKNYFEKNKHIWVRSSSLVPSDPSVLFTTAGMQQFKPYFTGQSDPMKDFGSLNVASIQKCMRTSDIDEVGDESHLTFFEMLGHFSFGGYFKNETINWTFDFLTKVLNISEERISVSVFRGDDKIPFDEESYKTWIKLIPQDKINKGPREDNVWGPNGPEGPCGPANEVYVDDMEVATLVFMEYYSDKEAKLTPLSKKGVDVGWGFERVMMISQNKKNVFETDLFTSLVEMLPPAIDPKIKRIIADHIRATAFMLADGIRPSNKDQGYVLRRIIRRTIVQSHIYNFPGDMKKSMLRKVVNMYKHFYPELDEETIIDEFKKESEKFRRTLHLGLRELDRIENIDAKSAFRLYESFGLPFEIIKELGDQKAKQLKRLDFEEEFRKHQEISKAGSEKKFGGHGLVLDTGELKAGNEEELKKVTRLHTATHLLNAALIKVLGSEVKQAGSDITVERLRFDFTFPRKLTDEEIKKVEELVNKTINDDLNVTIEEMKYEDAIKSGALAFFKLKYPEKVNVYSIGNFSKELCGGPHVTHTGEIGKFKIIKEESISAGVRRIRASIE